MTHSLHYKDKKHSTSIPKEKKIHEKRLLQMEFIKKRKLATLNLKRHIALAVMVFSPSCEFTLDHTFVEDSIDAFTGNDLLAVRGGTVLV